MQSAVEFKCCSIIYSDQIITSFQSGNVMISEEYDGFNTHSVRIPSAVNWIPYSLTPETNYFITDNLFLHSYLFIKTHGVNYVD